MCGPCSRVIVTGNTDDPRTSERSTAASTGSPAG
jgi:hypothetical protein